MFIRVHLWLLLPSIIIITSCDRFSLRSPAYKDEARLWRLCLCGEIMCSGFSTKFRISYRTVLSTKILTLCNPYSKITSMKTIRTIKNILTRHREELTRNYRVHQIGIFGSYVRNESDLTSDLDILVEFNEPVSLLGLVALENHLNELIGVKVDVIPKKDIRPELRKRILNEVVYL
ncbi:MAG: nucleotidyltransferase family protein [Planctomycetota bacterium]|nr:nucleotidyltransferase family protein [Planctomycetota bacterium]